MKTNNKLILISIIVLIGFLVSIFYHYILSGPPFNLTFPYNSFMTSKFDRFNDYTNVYGHIRSLDPYTNNPVYAHFPIMAFLLYPITLLGENIGLLFLLSMFILYHLWYVHGNINSELDFRYHYIVIIACMTYPFIMSIDRANSEVIVYIFLTLFLTSYQKGEYSLSTVFLGFAIGMKLFPAVFLLLYLDKKMYRYVFYSFSLAIIFNILALLILDGGLFQNLTALSNNFSVYQYHYVELHRGIGYGHTLWGVFKVFYHGLQSMGLHVNSIRYFMLPYTLFVFLVFGWVSLYVLNKERVYWRKVALLVFCMNLFPFVSGAYKMMYIYLPLLLFVNSEPNKNDTVFCIIFSLLLIPKHYLPLAWVPPFSISGLLYDLTNWSEVIIDPFLMFLAGGIIVTQGIRTYKSLSAPPLIVMKLESWERIFSVVGILFIFTGIVINEYLLTYFFSDDMVLEVSTKLMIWFADIIFILTGLIIWLFRSKIVRHIRSMLRDDTI